MNTKKKKKKKKKTYERSPMVCQNALKRVVRGERIFYRIDRHGHDWSCGGGMECRKDLMFID
jgi:hypothetical protein